MNYWLSESCDFLLTHWQEATILDFGRLAVVVVVAGWLTTQISQRSSI